MDNQTAERLTDVKSEPKFMDMATLARGEGEDTGNPDEQEFNIRDRGGVVKGYMTLHVVKQPTIDRFRDIRNGDGRRKPDVAGARQYLFRRCYGKTPGADGAPNSESGFRFAEQFSGWELDLRPYQGTPRDKEIAFWLTEGEMIVDATLIAYLNHFFPDIDSKKS